MPGSLPLTPSLLRHALALLALTALLAPLGYALLRLLRLRLVGLPGLAVALGLGYAAAVPLFLLELSVGMPLVPVAAALCLVRLRPGRAQAAAARGWAVELALPLAAAGLALLVGWGDVATAPGGGFSFRVGFDVSDGAFYAAVGQELLRAPLTRLEVPMFAGVPLQYSLAPSALAALAARYSGLELLPVVTATLPAFGLFWTALAAMAFAQAALDAGLRGRILSGLLVVLGGDLSYLAPVPSSLERTSHFLVFHSFSAEALFYNPWMLGAPLLFASLIAAREALAGGRLAWLAAGLLAGSLWPTKVFAFICLAGAFGLAALLRRSAAHARLALATLACAAPWVAQTLASPQGPGAPLRFSPFYPVYAWAATYPGVERMAAQLGALQPSPRLALPGLLLLSLPCLAGALGVRLLGLPRLAAGARHEPDGLHVPVAAAVGLSLLLAFTIVGHPTRVNGTQFLMVGLYLLWPYAAGALEALLASPARWRRAAGAALLAAAVISPAGYLARKLLPEALTAPAAWDRRRFTLPAPAAAACSWLRDHSPRDASVVVPLGIGPRDGGGLLPLYVAAVANRRVSATPNDIAMAPGVGDRRRALVTGLFAARTPAEAELLLDQLGAGWVWEPAEQPLASRPPSLETAFEAEGVRVLRRRAPLPRG